MGRATAQPVVGNYCDHCDGETSTRDHPNVPTEHDWQRSVQVRQGTPYFLLIHARLLLLLLLTFVVVVVSLVKAASSRYFPPQCASQVYH